MTAPAMSSSWRRTSAEASFTTSPMWKVVRLEVDDRSNGVTLVSGITQRTLSSGTDSSSAAICASTVWAPWPCSTALVITSTLPSLLSLTKPNDAVGVSVDLRMQANPRPRRAPDGAVRSSGRS